MAVIGGLSVGVTDGSQTEITRGSFDVVTTRRTYETGGTASGSPALTDDALYVADGTETCYALSPTGGEELWRYGSDTELIGPAADGMYLGGADGTVRALTADEGDERWVVGLDDPVPAAPIRWGEFVIALDKGGDSTRSTRPTGAASGQAASTAAGRARRSAAAFGNNSVYVASAEVASLDPPGTVQTPTPTVTPDDTPTPTDPGDTATPTETLPGTTPTETPTDTPGSAGNPTPTATQAENPTPTPSARPTAGRTDASG